MFTDSVGMLQSTKSLWKVQVFCKKAHSVTNFQNVAISYFVNVLCPFFHVQADMQEWYLTFSLLIVKSVTIIILMKMFVKLIKQCKEFAYFHKIYFNMSPASS